MGLGDQEFTPFLNTVNTFLLDNCHPLKYAIPVFAQAEAPRLYRQFFTAEECARLDDIDPGSPLHELNLLRVLMTRLLEAASRGRQNLERLADMLAAFCRAGGTVASLARIYYKQQGPPPDSLLAELALIDTDPL